MTKKTRIRVARIAAGAVIAAGASLTAAGAASALDLNVGLTATTADPAPDPTGIPTDPAPTDPAPTETTPTEPAPTEPDPTEPAPTEPEPTEPAPTATEPTEDPDPTEDPTEEPGSGSSSAPAENGTGGNDADPNGGSSAQEEGSSALTDTGSDTQAQGKDGALAETGAGQTTFLLIGAATMIAGGIGFRLMPRLAGGRGGAAA
ncbi:hypothetical protein ACLQ18_10475 [Streptomyces sp. DT193]|uniref:hypothetical protein n=1 Tax=Streptomyces sp. DT193 TaxID=3393418 RepID=UPI003CEC3DB0